MNITDDQIKDILKELKPWDKDEVLIEALDKVIDIYSMEYEVSKSQAIGTLVILIINLYFRGSSNKS